LTLARPGAACRLSLLRVDRCAPPDLIIHPACAAVRAGLTLLHSHG
jgi:hypothetical protein